MVHAHFSVMMTGQTHDKILGQVSLFMFVRCTLCTALYNTQTDTDSLERYKDRQTNKQRVVQAAERQTSRQAEKQADIQTESRQTDRQSNERNTPRTWAAANPFTTGHNRRHAFHLHNSHDKCSILYYYSLWTVYQHFLSCKTSFTPTRDVWFYSTTIIVDVPAPTDKYNYQRGW